MMVRNIRRWLAQLSETSRSEHDERDHLLRLNAIRDAFVVVMSLLLILMLVNSLLDVEQRQAAAPIVLIILPILALLLVGLTAIVSWKIRGGGVSVAATLFQAAFIGIGLLAGAVLFVLVSATGVVHFVTLPLPYLAGMLVGFALLMTVLTATAPRRR